MNAQVGLCRPGKTFGADVCHLKLHKTLLHPARGGGPGMARVGVAAHLKPLLPTQPVSSRPAGRRGLGASPRLGGERFDLLHCGRYIGYDGPPTASATRTSSAILNANYGRAPARVRTIRALHAGGRGGCRYECILDTRGLKGSAGIEVEDIAKRISGTTGFPRATTPFHGRGHGTWSSPPRFFVFGESKASSIDSARR